MQSNPINESQEEKQSANYWIVRRHGGTRRRIHIDKECYQLQTSNKEVRHAHPTEVESNDLCRWCDPDVEVDRSRTAERLHAKLLAMDPDDVGREAQS